MKRGQLTAIIVVCALAFVGCRSTTGRSFGQQVDDKTTTAQVKTKLITERFSNLFSTDVGTNFGVVHLGGTVQTPEQRAEAERIASRTTGVKRVVNQIVVVPRDQATAKAGDGASPAASPGPSALTGEITAIDAASGDVTLKTSSGDVVVRLPAATARDLHQGQRLSINAGGAR